MRVKTGTVRHRKHKQYLENVKGARMSLRKRIKAALEANLHAGEYAFAGRKQRKNDFRTLWIQRINAALTDTGINYSNFMGGLKKANISLNRKMLADLALNHSTVFTNLVKRIKA